MGFPVLFPGCTVARQIRDGSHCTRMSSVKGRSLGNIMDHWLRWLMSLGTNRNGVKTRLLWRRACFRRKWVSQFQMSVFTQSIGSSWSLLWIAINLMAFSKSSTVTWIICKHGCAFILVCFCARVKEHHKESMMHRLGASVFVLFSLLLLSPSSSLVYPEGWASVSLRQSER